jgi:hypothetical protein
LNETILTWNVPNFITVGLIGIIMFTLFGTVAQLVKSRGGMATRLSAPMPASLA